MANTALKASVFDILAYVIGVISGGRDVQRAADGLGVKRQTILAWLEKGIGHLAFNQGDDLATSAGIPVELLRSRRGPHDYNDGE
jgi:hypothetical protein